jgi:DNA polymerase-3 subunit gamma/tau
MEKFIVSARKYRPKTFRDVIGQPSVTTTLKNSILNHHLGHAYLFSGPKGVGKTTCARIFARTINCSSLSESGEACDQCESCRSFNQNRSFSIHELDAASNNSVDDIRLLTEQVRIPPQVGRYSIYIIDEVHMLSASAFNAFLKTLEEPPAHAIFILATTEKHKIIPTILSRCQIFDFNRIRVEDTVAYLKSIADAESLAYEEDALHLIAQKADGAMRDALSIFDQVVSFSKERISYHDVIRNLNILDYEYYFRLTALALEGDAPSMLLLFNEVLTKGFDPRNFLNGYATHLRDLMVCKDLETVQLLQVGAGIREKYLSQSQMVPLQFIYEGLEICNQADIQFRSSRNQRLTIELALVRISRLPEVQKKKPVADPPPREVTVKTADTPPLQEMHSGGQVEKSAGQENANHDNRVVRKATLSIKGALKEIGESSVPVRLENQQVEEPSYQETGAEAGLDPLVVLKAWDEYSEKFHHRKPRIHSTLQTNRPVVNPDGTIQVQLNSEAQKEHFMKDINQGLVRFLREFTGVASLGIQVTVRESEQNGKKIYTDQDKLEYLIRKNPGLARLKTRFSLDFDN